MGLWRLIRELGGGDESGDRYIGIRNLLIRLICLRLSNSSDVSVRTSMFCWFSINTVLTSYRDTSMYCIS
jgi:hypothetical protein